MCLEYIFLFSFFPFSFTFFLFSFFVYFFPFSFPFFLFRFVYFPPFSPFFFFAFARMTYGIYVNVPQSLGTWAGLSKISVILVMQ